MQLSYLSYKKNESILFTDRGGCTDTSQLDVICESKIFYLSYHIPILIRYLINSLGRIRILLGPRAILMELLTCTCTPTIFGCPICTSTTRKLTLYHYYQSCYANINKLKQNVKYCNRKFVNLIRYKEIVQWRNDLIYPFFKLKKIHI